MPRINANYNRIGNCRLCLENDKFKISIFCDYAVQCDVRNKIKKYLSITVEKNDSLPKYICYKCLSNLNETANFITKSNENQNVLQTEKDNNENSFFEDPMMLTPEEIKHNSENSLRALRRKSNYYDDNTDDLLMSNPNKLDPVFSIEDSRKPIRRNSFPRSMTPNIEELSSLEQNESQFENSNRRGIRGMLMQRSLRRRMSEEKKVEPDTSVELAQKSDDEDLVKRKKQLLSAYIEKLKKSNNTV